MELNIDIASEDTFFMGVYVARLEIHFFLLQVPFSSRGDSSNSFVVVIALSYYAVCCVHLYFLTLLQ